MKIEELLTHVLKSGVEGASQKWPVASLRWRNRKLFASVNARALRGMLVCCFCMMGVGLAWQVFSAMGWLSSQRVALKQLQFEQTALRNQRSLQQIKSDALALATEQRKAEQLEYQLALDDLLLAWPNSVFRGHVIHHLQHMANSQQLQIVQMKLTPLPNDHGYEAGLLSFSLKGTKLATYSFWHSLNQLFQNGTWTALIWRLLPLGGYSLEGQVHLLWDAEDAFTDTGVELQAVTRPVSKAKELIEDTHVWPDQALSQMRLVGAVQSVATSNKESVWTLLQSGRHIQAVRTGQYLGIEKRRVLYLDTQGLWLEGGSGTDLERPSSLLAWEKVSP